MLQEAKSVAERRAEAVDATRRAITAPAFPRDAAAVIYQPARSAMTSGKARTREWKLRFERRSPQFIEPLMGWTGDDDPLSQIDLTFPTLEAAIGYARRHGLAFTVRGDSNEEAQRRFRTNKLGVQVAMSDRSTARREPRLEWVERTLRPDTMEAAPAASAHDYSTPRAVLADERLSREQKHDVLHRWALDAYHAEVAVSQGTGRPKPMPLDDVIDALLELDEQSVAMPAIRNGRNRAAAQTRAAA